MNLIARINRAERALERASWGNLVWMLGVYVFGSLICLGLALPVFHMTHYSNVTAATFWVCFLFMAAGTLLITIAALRKAIKKVPHA